MAVYKRCPSCYKDKGLFNRHCVKCKAILGGKYSVRVKDMDTGKWKTKVVPSLRLAHDIEHKFKVGIIEGSLFPSELTKSKRQTISFDVYLDFAKMTKKSWKDDQQRWMTHVAGKDYRTQSGVLRILQDMKNSRSADFKPQYQPATIEQVLKLIRRVYNWHRVSRRWYWDNPCDGIKLPKYDNRVNSPLSKQEASQLIRYLETHDKPTG